MQGIMWFFGASMYVVKTGVEPGGSIADLRGCRYRRLTDAAGTCIPGRLFIGE